jgi:hypothetical protein
VLNVLVHREEKLARVQLNEDASQSPHVGGLGPGAAMEDDFRSTVLSGVDHPGVMLLVKSSPPEVDDLYPRAVGQEVLPVFPALFDLDQFAIHKANILRLEIGVG